jgi:hypothetical protein
MVRMAGGAADGRQVRRLVLTLVVLVLVLVILKMSAFSGAGFFLRSANPVNALAAGTLTIANDRAGTYVLDAAGLRPGESRQGDVRLNGDDDFTAGLTIAAVGLTVTPGSSTIAGALHLRIDDVTNAQQLYSGALRDLGTVTPPPAPLAPAAQRVLRFTVTFPLAAAVPALQDNGAELTVRITGVSQ